MNPSARSGDSVRTAREALLCALRDSSGRSDAIDRISRTCMELLPIDGVSISLIVNTDRRETLYASDEVVADIESLQFSLGEGPCFEAAKSKRPVLVADLRGTVIRTWPVFATEIGAHPVGAIFAFPLMSGLDSVGALDLYRRTRGRLSTAQVAIAMQVADIVTLAVLRSYPNDPTASWWTELPVNRARVHQATGMIIAASHISEKHALARLRGYAFAVGRLVDDVADDLVAHRMDPGVLDTH
ncbi:GAF and ANTAR domain-containing protein [Nocardia sp. NPDC056000]|uniref:GAF and ANTAR domain-containing protein n=1 Tax=Nocardia sp. NPDC056000 TaxID=3345674 RepID=UPI0035E1F672